MSKDNAIENVTLSLIKVGLLKEFEDKILIKDDKTAETIDNIASLKYQAYTIDKTILDEFKDSPIRIMSDDNKEVLDELEHLLLKKTIDDEMANRVLSNDLATSIKAKITIRNSLEMQIFKFENAKRRIIAASDKLIDLLIKYNDENKEEITKEIDDLVTRFNYEIAAINEDIDKQKRLSARIEKEFQEVERLKKQIIDNLDENKRLKNEIYTKLENQEEISKEDEKAAKRIGFGLGILGAHLLSKRRKD